MFTKPAYGNANHFRFQFTDGSVVGISLSTYTNHLFMWGLVLGSLVRELGIGRAIILPEKKKKKRKTFWIQNDIIINKYIT